MVDVDVRISSHLKEELAWAVNKQLRVISTTVNRELFMYENTCVLNVYVNKFLCVPHENIITGKFFKFIEITVHLLLIKY